MNLTHQYPAKFQPDTWTDLKRIQELDNRSINSLLHEFIRNAVKDKLIELREHKKNRERLRCQVR